MTPPAVLTPLDSAAEHLALGADIRHPEVVRRVRRGRPFRGIAGGADRRAQLQSAQTGLRPHVRQTQDGAPVIPFTSAAHERTEGPFADVTYTPGAADTNIAGSPFQIPSYGYLRAVWLLITGTGGTLGAGALAADYPYSALSNISLTDVNGAPIFGPLDGYAALWQNIIGGAAGGVNDPRALPFVVSTINFAFAVRVPLEISHRDGTGALANQNSAANYRLNLTGANTAAPGPLFTTAPTTPPNIRVRAFAECWTIPNNLDVLDRPQAQMPPRLGTAQYVTQYLADVAAGANTVRLARTGNLLRSLLVIARTTAAGLPRQDNVMMEPLDFQWDGRNIHQGMLQNYITGVLMREKLPDLVSRDTGVFAFPFNTSDHNMIGDDSPTFWWPTVQSSRLELRGSSGNAGRLQLVTGDVAPAEVAPEERYDLRSETGFTPEVGVPIRAAG